MKLNKIVFVILLIFTCEKSFSKPSDYCIILTVNLNDCINCNKALFDLEKMKDQFPITIIFKKEFRSDSAFIFKKYDFGKVASRIIWSDSLFEYYAPDGRTRGIIESKYKTARFGAPIHDWNQLGYFNFLERQNLNVDTLFDKKYKYARGAEKFEFSDNGIMGINIPYKQQIVTLNLINQFLYNTITVDIETLRKTFAYNDDKYPVSEFENQQTAMRKAGVPQLYEIRDFCFSGGDTVLVELNNRYFQYVKNGNGGIDTSLEYNIAILEYSHTHLLNDYKMIFKKKTNDNLYFMQDFVHVFNNVLYTKAGAMTISSKRADLATFHLNDNYEYEMFPSTNRPVLKMFEKMDRFNIPVYYKSYYTYLPCNKIYDLKSGAEVENLDFLEDQGLIDRGFKLKFEIREFAMNKDFVWLSLMDYYQVDQKKLYKFNRKTRKVELSKFEFPQKENTLMNFDPLNPDYIIFKNKDGFIERRKVF